MDQNSSNKLFLATFVYTYEWPEATSQTSMRILVPLTDALHSWPGLEHTLSLFPEANIVVLNVIDPTGAAYGEQSAENDEERNTAEELFTAANDLAAEYGVELETTTVEGRPADAIVDYADEHSIDQIVMGSRGRTGVSRILLGSVAGTVVQDSSVPVTVVP